MTRQIVMVIGAVLLTIGSAGVFLALVWLTVSRVHGTLPYIYDTHAEIMLFFLPALLLIVAIVGAVFVARAQMAAPKDPSARKLHAHMRFHP